ncbi:TetR/AcrR family transcriptional regulator [Pelagibius sp.]|uniref:TetR/AcrR family transcriptional regulator n=1 Tax=Pelagibius sp. TaxID=1931238 RepID=UPI003B507F4F
MGRPRAFDTEAALDIAMRHFWNEGYAAARLDDICDEAGLSKPSLYAAFGDKDALYEKALERYAEVFKGRVIGALEGAASAAEMVEGYFSEVAAILTDRKLPLGCLRVNTSSECAESRPALAKAAEVQRSGTRDHLRALLQNYGLDSRSAQEMAQFMITLSDGLAAGARAGATPGQTRTTARLAAQSVSNLL